MMDGSRRVAPSYVLLLLVTAFSTALFWSHWRYGHWDLDNAVVTSVYSTAGATLGYMYRRKA
jgi:hypothetical protein